MAIETTGELDATDKLAITRDGFYLSSSVALTADVEAVTATVTVLLLKPTDTLLIQARQYLAGAPAITSPPSIIGRVRVGDVTGQLLDGLSPAPFCSSPGTGKADATYAKRGVVEQSVRHGPGVIGPYTIVMTAIAVAVSGSARDRSLTVQVKSS
jgi:hypothetical protein